MNYSTVSIRIPSRWFDEPERKMNTFQKMGGYKGFYLYLQLYKFRIHSQANDHTFMTSISFLRKETGYTAEEVFDLLKKLKTAKIISVSGVSRWDYLLDDKGQIEKDKALLITVNQNESFPIFDDYDKPKEFFIYISFSLLKMYEDKGLDEKHFALHCLVQRMQHNDKNVCYMSIESMSEVLNLDKDTINRMIYNLNKNYLMVSFRKSNKHRRGEGSYRYEHITYEDSKKYKNENVSNWDSWLFRYKSEMDVIANRAAKKAERKSKQRKKNQSVKEKNKSTHDEFISNIPLASVDESYISLNVEDEEVQMEPLENCFQEYVTDYKDYQEVGIQTYKKIQETKRENPF